MHAQNAFVCSFCVVHNNLWQQNKASSFSVFICLHTRELVTAFDWERCCHGHDAQQQQKSGLRFLLWMATLNDTDSIWNVGLDSTSLGKHEQKRIWEWNNLANNGQLQNCCVQQMMKNCSHIFKKESKLTLGSDSRQLRCVSEEQASNVQDSAEWNKSRMQQGKHKWLMFDDNANVMTQQIQKWFLQAAIHWHKMTQHERGCCCWFCVGQIVSSAFQFFCCESAQPLEKLNVWVKWCCLWQF